MTPAEKAECRAEFERVISRPPYEHMCDRNSDNSAWPGQYKRYETQLAWDLWQACWNLLKSREKENNREQRT